MGVFTTRNRSGLKWVVVVAITAAVVAPSAVLAADRFSDVPTTNVFVEDIEWLADAGVTTGCGGDKFCPGGVVTREQMAAFLRRLAENQVVDAATSLDSAELGGATSDELVPVMAAEDDGVVGAIREVSKGLVETNSVTIVAPEDGVLIISGTSFIDPDAVAASDFILRTKIDGKIVGLAGWSALFRPDDPDQIFDLSYTVSEQVSAGTHTVTQEVGPKAGTSTFYHNHETLTVLFVPSGQAVISSSTAPAGATIVESETGAD